MQTSINKLGFSAAKISRSYIACLCVKMYNAPFVNPATISGAIISEVFNLLAYKKGSVSISFRLQTSVSVLVTNAKRSCDSPMAGW